MARVELSAYRSPPLTRTSSTSHRTCTGLPLDQKGRSISLSSAFLTLFTEPRRPGYDSGNDWTCVGVVRRPRANRGRSDVTVIFGRLRMVWAVTWMWPRVAIIPTMQCVRINAEIKERNERGVAEGSPPSPQPTETSRRRPERRIQDHNPSGSP